MRDQKEGKKSFEKKRKSETPFCFDSSASPPPQNCIHAKYTCSVFGVDGGSLVRTKIQNFVKVKKGRCVCVCLSVRIF